MRRSELEHIICASGDIAKDDEIIVIGSQSILGQFPDAPVRLLASMEMDVYPNNKPELADSIDGAIGEGSKFHELNGYYAQGVCPDTTVLPNCWEERLIVVNNENTGGISGLCLEIHDLAISKLIAARPKDLEFIQELIRQNMIEQTVLTERLDEMQLGEAEHRWIGSKIVSLFAK